MKGQIRFQYSCENDVVTAHVDWHLQTTEDLRRSGQVSTTPISRGASRNKVDLILELTKFRLSPRLAPRFRDVRNRILLDYTNRSYRVNEATIERAMMYAGVRAQRRSRQRIRAASKKRSQRSPKIALGTLSRSRARFLGSQRPA